MLGHSSSSISEQPWGQEGPWRQAHALLRSHLFSVPTGFTVSTVDCRQDKQNVKVVSMFMYLCVAAWRRAQNNGCKVK